MAPFGRRGLTSPVGAKGGIAPGRAFWRLFKKRVFLERHSAISLRFARQNDFQKCQNRDISSSKMMPCRFFVVFSDTLFLNDPTVIWAYFLISVGPGSWKRPARKHLKPFWQHIGKNTHLEITHGTENVQKSTQTGGPNGRLAAATGGLFSPGWPFGRHMNPQISKNTFRALIFRKIIKMCISSQVKLQNDAMSPFRYILGNPVFKWP